MYERAVIFRLTAGWLAPKLVTIWSQIRHGRPGDTSVTAPAFDDAQTPSVSEVAAVFRGCAGEVRGCAGDSLSVALAPRLAALSLTHGRCRS